MDRKNQKNVKELPISLGGPMGPIHPVWALAAIHPGWGILVPYQVHVLEQNLCLAVDVSCAI